MKQIFAKDFIFYKGKCCFLKNCHLYCVKRSNSTVMAYGLFKRTIVPLIVSPPSPGLPDKAGDGDRAPCRSRAVFRPCRSRGAVGGASGVSRGREPLVSSDQREPRIMPLSIGGHYCDNCTSCKLEIRPKRSSLSSTNS